MSIRLGNAEKRAKGRAQAVQFLFTREFDMDGLTSSPQSTADVMDGIVIDDYAYELYEGVISNIEQIDELIVQTSENWALSRMPVTDRSILRIAVYEMLYRDDVPVSVAINEAVELASKFGGEDESYKFVNGLLGKIAKSTCLEDEEEQDCEVVS